MSLDDENPERGESYTQLQSYKKENLFTESDGKGEGIFNSTIGRVTNLPYGSRLKGTTSPRSTRQPPGKEERKLHVVYTGYQVLVPKGL